MSSHGEPTIKFPRKTNKKECTIALLNVNSLPSKFIEIKELLVDGVFDILCIQETKLDSTFPNSQFHVIWYSIFRRDRKKGGGGVMIFVRDSIIAMPIKIVCKFVETILLDLTIGQTRFALIAAYKPPSVWETNYAIHWIEIYPVDSAIHLLNNWSLELNSQAP